MNRGEGMLSFYLQLLQNENDRVLFATIYEEYQQQMYWLAFRYLNNNALSEECVNDAFLELIKSFDTFAKLEKKKQRYYLLTITERCAFKKYHQEKKQRNLKQFDFEIVVEDSSISKTESMDLEQAINRLPWEYRYPLLLRYAQDQSYEKIADILNISVSSARQRVKRGRDRLALLLQEEEIKNG